DPTQRSRNICLLRIAKGDAARGSATARVDCRLGCAAEQRGEGLAARVRGGGDGVRRL
uniref:Uncharacterized protein n=1 Tax=Cucumis melo TaxID=3656 RepID=A0A9I9E6J9_CUCME